LNISISIANYASNMRWLQSQSAYGYILHHSGNWFE